MSDNFKLQDIDLQNVDWDDVIKVLRHYGVEPWVYHSGCGEGVPVKGLTCGKCGGSKEQDIRVLLAKAQDRKDKEPFQMKMILVGLVVVGIVMSIVLSMKNG